MLEVIMTFNLMQIEQELNKAEDIRVTISDITLTEEEFKYQNKLLTLEIQTKFLEEEIFYLSDNLDSLKEKIAIAKERLETIKYIENGKQLESFININKRFKNFSMKNEKDIVSETQKIENQLRSSLALDEKRLKILEEDLQERTQMYQENVATLNTNREQLLDIYKVKAEELREQIKKEEKENEITIKPESDFQGPLTGNPKASMREIYQIMTEASKEFSVPIELLHGVIMQESGYEVDAYNDKNKNRTTDKGIMQINSNTAPILAKSLGIEYTEGIEYDPKIGIRMGAKYLQDQLNVNNDLHYVLTSYNRGPGGAKKLKDKLGSYESSYSRSVIMHMDSFTDKFFE